MRHTGENPTPRDPGPHAHAIHVDPSNRWALVADLGLDKVFVYPYDAERGALGPDPRQVEMEKGAGPRHLAFDPDGKGVFVLNELNGTVVSFSFDPTDGWMEQIHSMWTLEQGYQGKNSSAEVAVSPDGRFLYASNRGPDNIAIFEILRPSRRLRRVGHQPTRGKHPRHFAIDPSRIVPGGGQPRLEQPGGVPHRSARRASSRRWPAPSTSRSRSASACGRPSSSAMDRRLRWGVLGAANIAVTEGRARHAARAVLRGRGARLA